MKKLKNMRTTKSEKYEVKGKPLCRKRKKKRKILSDPQLLPDNTTPADTSQSWADRNIVESTYTVIPEKRRENWCEILVVLPRREDRYFLDKSVIYDGVRWTEIII